jgi:hypothetical protein
VLAVASAALGRLALLPAALGLLPFHAGEVVVLPRLAAFVGSGRGLVLAFLVLLTRLVALLAVLDVAIGHSCSPSTGQAPAARGGSRRSGYADSNSNK